MKRSVLRDIWSCFGKSIREFEEYKGKLLLSSIVTLLIQISGLYETFVLAGITDSLYKRNGKSFYVYLLIAVIVGLVTILLDLFGYWLDVIIQQQVLMKLKLAAINRLCKRSEAVASYSSGEQNSIVQEDCNALVSFVFEIISYAYSIGVILYVGATLIWISPKWAGIFAIVQIAVGIIQRRGVKKIEECSRDRLASENEFQKYLNEELVEMHAIRYENLGNDVVSFVKKNLSTVMKKRFRQNRCAVGISSMSEGVMYIGKMLLFFGMGYEVLHGRVTMREYIVFYSYMTTFTGNFMSVIQMMTSLQPMLINVRRLLGVLHTEPLEAEEYQRVGTLELQSVEKKFGEKVLFSNTDVVLDFRKNYALLGANGTGKTTFAKMLMGEEGVNGGTILLDGMEKEIIPREKMTGIRYFAAKPCVFSGMTLRENFLLGINNKQIQDETLCRICNDFLFFEDIRQMDNGLETVLGKDVSLSSGQMKKVELIRAALSDADVIVLDEPMANLDEEFRKRFKEIYDKYFKQRKVLILEHDEKRVAYVDEILWIKNGLICSRSV